VRGGAPWAPGCGSKHDRTATSMAPLQQCLKLYTATGVAPQHSEGSVN
jgi:hypothetical protein